MEFNRLLELVGSDPVFESALLLAGEVDPAGARLQLSRWVSSGKIYQLRRGLYTLAPPYQKVRPHPFVIANHMVRASYVSLQSALAFYGLIPEYTPLTISVTAKRPGRWETPLGSFEFRHIKTDLLNGYRLTQLDAEQRAFIAAPEKALLDLVYLQPGSDARPYLQELRLQNLEQLDLDKLRQGADSFQSPKIKRAAEIISALAFEEKAGYETL